MVGKTESFRLRNLDLLHRAKVGTKSSTPARIILIEFGRLWHSAF
jgi:hypothetical protein